MAPRYIIHTPNPEFAERVMGVRFDKGKAMVDEYTIDKSLGYTVEEIARRLEKDFNYTVEVIEGSSVEPEKAASRSKKKDDGT